MDPITPPPLNQPPSPTEQGVRVGPIIRDIVIVIALTAVGGFIIGLTGALTSPRGMVAIGVSNLLLGTIGFVISGYLARGNRWQHLAYVAVGVWLFGLVNVFAFGFGIGQWVFSAVVIALMMGVGGGISFALRKDDGPPA